MGSKAKRTWKEKLLDSKGFPSLQPIEGKMASKWGEGTMLIAAPIEVNEIMKTVKKGKLITIDEIRRQLAEKHGATVTCSLTTGIFAWIAANAADEDEQQGRSRITPYWRTVKAGGELNPKYPGGIDNVRRRLESEGHSVIQRGKKYFVESLMKKGRSKAT
ncbi:MAG: methylated DNA-protein cysteine methyltransferase [Planctomycetaceae bacterium]